MEKIRSYAIHILAIGAVDGCAFDLPREQNAVIMCTSRKNEHVQSCKPENILVLDFPDVEDPRYPGAFNAAHARKIIRFVSGLSSEVTDLYVCCSKGGSRSPAVAAALLRMSGRSDGDVWRNPYYVPNALVYYRLCRECRLVLTRIPVWLRVMRNRLAYRRACRRGPGEYERWQILF